MPRSLPFFIAQAEIKQIEVIADMLSVLRSRDDDVAILDVPAQDDLRIALAIFLRQFGEERLVDQALSP